VSQERARYSSYTKQQVRERYPLCRTTEDKRILAAELNIFDEDGAASVPKLYNLASRLKATGRASADDLASAVANHDDHLRHRQIPEETEFTRDGDRYLRSEFGRRPPELIAKHLHLTETAVIYRARHIGLRKPVKYWPGRKVKFWLGNLSEAGLRKLAKEGVDIIPQADRSGHVQLEVVSTMSLARWMQVEGNLERLRARDADEFFILEILESVDDIVNGNVEFELCKFLSHGHICQNPFTEVSYGLFCTNTDRQRAGQDPRCSVRNLSIDDLRPPR
jgi:hypothetical protein